MGDSELLSKEKFDNCIEDENTQAIMVANDWLLRFHADGFPSKYGHTHDYYEFRRKGMILLSIILKEKKVSKSISRLSKQYVINYLNTFSPENIKKLKAEFNSNLES